MKQWKLNLKLRSSTNRLRLQEEIQTLTVAFARSNTNPYRCVCKKKYKPLPLRLQELQRKGDGGWKKCLCVVFRLTRRSRVCGENNAIFGILYQEQQLLARCQTHYDYVLQNVFKAGTVNFVNSLSPPSVVKKVQTGSKNSQGI